MNQRFPNLSTLFLIIAVIALLQLPTSLLISSVSIPWGILVNEVVIIAGIPLLLIWWRRFDRAQLLPFKHFSFQTLVVVILLTMSADLVIDYLAAASELIFPLPEAQHQKLERIMSVSPLIICLLPGICEEIFFRGFCQTTLAAHWGRQKGIIGSAVLFALLHANPWYIHLYFLLGLLLSWIYATTGSLWLPMVAHAVNNTWTFVHHTEGIRFPRNGFFDPLDLTLMTLGLLITIISIRALTKETRRLE